MATKMILVPEDFLKKAPMVNQTEREMDELLHNKTVPDDIKVKKHEQLRRRLDMYKQKPKKLST